ncbi:MAG: hypothetical protein HYV26_24550 [Candidatus Hydrogenedentes bacterium]|nr:hypothetical protein [Candidatus Hydrogenedentota bacterium]
MIEHTAVVISSLSDEGIRFERRIRQALEKFGIKVLQLNSSQESGAVWAALVTDAITKADFIVAELSDRNPNVVYEIGYAHALGKHVFLFPRQDGRALPSDLAGQQMLIYSSEQDLESLVQDKVLPQLGRLRIAGNF